MAKRPKTPHEKLIEFINDDSLSGDSALLAAAICLMDSAEIAKDMKDIDGLIRTANAWYDIAKTLLGISETEEEKRPFGFGVADLVELGEDEENGTELYESTDGIKIRKEPW
jgi:hypothetical protein